MGVDAGESGEGMRGGGGRVCGVLVWVNEEAEFGNEIVGLVRECEELYPIERGVP